MDSNYSHNSNFCFVIVRVCLDWTLSFASNKYSVISQLHWIAFGRSCRISPHLSGNWQLASCCVIHISSSGMWWMVDFLLDRQWINGNFMYNWWEPIMALSILPQSCYRFERIHSLRIMLNESSVRILTLRSTGWTKTLEIKRFLFFSSSASVHMKVSFSCIISEASVPHWLCRHAIEGHPHAAAVTL